MCGYLSQPRWSHAIPYCASVTQEKGPRYSDGTGWREISCSSVSVHPTLGSSLWGESSLVAASSPLPSRNKSRVLFEKQTWAFEKSEEATGEHTIHQKAEEVRSLAIRARRNTASTGYSAEALRRFPTASYTVYSPPSSTSNR